MMYRVDLVQTVIEETTVYVEANTHDEAEVLALQHCFDDGVKWNYCDTKDDPEVIAVEAATWALPTTPQPIRKVQNMDKK